MAFKISLKRKNKDIGVSENAPVKVLGAGCASCHKFYENTKKVAEPKGLEVAYITDMPKVMAYGVTSMPALVVNEKVVSQGKVLKPEEVAVLLEKEGY